VKDFPAPAVGVANPPPVSAPAKNPTTIRFPEVGVAPNVTVPDADDDDGFTVAELLADCTGVDDECPVMSHAVAAMNDVKLHAAVRANADGDAPTSARHIPPASW
jgi:hypothetical protein